MTDQPISLLERARQLQAEVNARNAAAQSAAAVPVEPPAPQFAQELIPDVTSDYQRTEEDLELDRILDGVGIVEAYSRWCGKMTPKVTTGRTESIMVSCPKPSHADKNPSAWLNTEKNTWYCAGCTEGGDGYDIAAYHHGYPVPGYKDGAMFHKLRRSMGEDLGYTFNKKTGGGYDLVPPVVVLASPPPAPVPAPRPNPTVPTETDPAGVQAVQEQPVAGHLSLVPPPAPLDFAPLATGIPAEVDVPSATVISIDPEADAYDPELDSDSSIPRFDWRAALAGYEDTFLYQWCVATSADYSPEEYHLFSGLLLLGLAGGRDVLMEDDRPVMANLAICLLGKTGSGKSTAQNYIGKAIGYAMPENDLGILVEGVRYVGEVASGEALIGEFSKQVQGAVTGHVPIKGYVEFSELSTLLAKSSLSGSTLKGKIMDFIDGRGVIVNSSQTHGRKMAKDAFAAFSTSSQPRALRKLLDGQDSASGYLNRWLYVAGPNKDRPSFFGGQAVSMTSALNKLSGIAIASQKKNPTDPPRFMPVAPDAAGAFTDFFRPVHKMIMDSDNDMVARLEIHYKKLMLCHALNRHAAVVDLADVSFIEKLHPYLLQTFRMVGAQIGKSQGQEFVDRVLNYIRRKEVEFGNGMGPNRSMLNDAMKTKNIGTKQVNDAVDTLIRAGLIEEFKVQTGKAGRPPVRLRSVQHG